MSGKANAVDIDRESILNVQFNQDQSFPARNIIYICRQEVLSNSFFLLTFHLTRKDRIASLSSRTNCDYFLFRANLNFIYGRMPETRSCASPRSGNKLVPCNYIISANLFWSFAMWQKTGTLSSALPSEIHWGRKTEATAIFITGVVNVLRDATNLTLNV